MSNDTDFKKYDTRAETNYWNVKLAKDAVIKEFGGDKFVGLTFVDSSRFESDIELWVEANPNKSQVVMGSYLEKGDVVGFKGGKLTARQYGDNNEKVGFNLRNCELIVPLDLIATLKERGFTPGSDVVKGAAPVKAKGKPGRPAGSKNAPAPAKKKTSIPIEIDLDDDEAEDE